MLCLLTKMLFRRLARRLQGATEDTKDKMKRPLQKGGGGGVGGWGMLSLCGSFLRLPVAWWVTKKCRCRIVLRTNMLLNLECTAERINCYKPFSLVGPFLIDTIIKNAPKKITENAWK